MNAGTTGAVTVTNASYNGAVTLGASTSFGYTGTGDDSGTPTNITCTTPCPAEAERGAGRCSRQCAPMASI